MDNQTRQFGADDSDSQNRSRPQQYFPDQSDQSNEYTQSYNQSYEEPYYPPEPAYGPEPHRSNTAAIALGILSAIFAVASVVLFFLWRASAEEANKPPVTVTQTTTATTTVTTTKRAFDFGLNRERDHNQDPNQEPEPLSDENVFDDFPDSVPVIPTEFTLPDVNLEEFFNRLDEWARQ